MPPRAQSLTIDSLFDSRFFNPQKLKKATRAARFPHPEQSSQFKVSTSKLTTGWNHFVDNPQDLPVPSQETHRL